MPNCHSEKKVWAAIKGKSLLHALCSITTAAINIHELFLDFRMTEQRTTNALVALWL